MRRNLGVILCAMLLVALASTAYAVQRTVLVELFTNAGCGYCPPAETAVHNLQLGHPEDAFVEYHVSWPWGLDPFYLYNTSDVNGRVNYYSVAGVPMIRVDGKFPASDATLPIMYNNRYNSPTPVTMGITGSYDVITREGTVTVTLSTDEELPNIDWVVRIALTETEIYFNTSYNDWHYNVMRDMLPNYQGTPIVLAVGQPVQVSYDFDLPTGVPPNDGIVEENARFVAWLQPAGTGAPLYRECYQAARVFLLEMDVSGVEVAAAPFELAANYPNPFNPVTTIPVQVDKTGSAVLEVLSVDGRRVTTLHEGELTPGLHEFSWDGTDAQGSPIASGVYLARLVGQTERQTQRMVLLK